MRLFLCIFVLFAAPATAAAAHERSLFFEPNRGQAPAGIDFIARSTGFTVLIQPGGGSLVVDGGDRFLWSLNGARQGIRGISLDAEPGTSNYLRGSDSGNWLRNIPHYRRIRYEAIYPGVDLIYYSSGGRLEYDFVLAPGSDGNGIRLEFPQAGGIRIESSGDLRIERGGRVIRQKKPAAYQDGSQGRKAVAARYIRNGNEFGIELGAYDVRLPVVIDPAIDVATYLGQSGADAAGYGIATDKQQNIFVAGRALSLASAAGAPNYDAFVAKLSAADGSPMYITYFGGSGDDDARGIAVDPDGSVYVVGQTFSADFPVSGDALQAQLGGPCDAFLVKLSPDGSSLTAATYLGGSGFDYATAVAEDAMGDVYVAGVTASGDFPATSGAAQPAAGGDADAFVAKWSAATRSLIYATYLGGSGYDAAAALAVDPSGNVILTGSTNSGDFPVTKKGVQTRLGGDLDAFAAKLDPQGGTLVYATYLGGSGPEWGTAVALDSGGNAYLTGWTGSSNFPVASALQPVFGGGVYDAFVVRLAADGTRSYATYLGGPAMDGGNAIAIGNDGNISIAGETASPAGPLTVIIGSPSGGNRHAYVTVLPAAGTSILSSFLAGGISEETGLAIAVDGGGRLCVTGETTSTDLPAAAAGSPDASGNAFVFRLSADAPALQPNSFHAPKRHDNLSGPGGG